MKIIFLNVWHGKIQQPLSNFITNHIDDTDVFCFQEAHHPFQARCDDLLADYNKVAATKTLSTVNDFCQVTYVKKSIDLVSSDTLFQDQSDIGLAVGVQIKQGDTSLYVLNVHGTSRPVEKLDNPARIRQSRELIEFLQTKRDPKVIGGDFNVFPTTQSIRMFKENGYLDLISEFKITNTRNHFNWDKYPDDDDSQRQYFSDYAFVAGDGIVKNFSVMPDEVSDHLPLALEYSASRSLATTQ